MLSAILSTAKGGTAGHLASVDVEHGIALGIPRVKARKLWKKVAGSILSESCEWWEGVLPSSSSFLCPNTKRPFENPVLVLASGHTVEASTFKEDTAETEASIEVKPSTETSIEAPIEMSEVECLRLRVKELELEVRQLKRGCVPNHVMRSVVLEVKSLLKKDIIQAQVRASGGVDDDEAVQRHMQSQLHTATVGKERVGHLMRRMSSAFKEKSDGDGDGAGVDDRRSEMCSAEFMHKAGQTGDKEDKFEAQTAETETTMSPLLPADATPAPVEGDVDVAKGGGSWLVKE